MIQKDGAVRVYLDKTLHGMVACPACHVQRAINMTRYDPKDLCVKALRVKCSKCYKLFHVRFDLRCYDRIPIHCAGVLHDAQTGVLLTHLTVVSLSVGGVGLELDTPVTLRIGTHYDITFQLDDPEASLVQETITVTRVHGHSVGAAFYPPDQYNHALDFYIFPALHPPHIALNSSSRSRCPP